MRAACAGLVLLVGAAVAGPVVSEGVENDPGLRLVIAHTDGTHAAAQLPLTEDDLRAATHLWAWTDRLPPRKLEITKPSLDAQQLVAELGRTPARSLAVRIKGWSRPEELAPVRVIAAPMDMWEDVPETLLPRFSVPKTGRVDLMVRDAIRIRVVADGSGTVWEQVGRTAKSIDISLRKPAMDAVLKIRSDDGTPIEHAFATVMRTRRGEAATVLQAQFASDERGVVRIPALPESEVITLILVGKGAASQVISGTAADLTREIRLQKGGQIRGRFVDEENKPLIGVTVEAEGWISGNAPATSRSAAMSETDGRWRIENLPGNEVIVRASSPGRATFRKKVALEGSEVDLGTIPLLRSPDVKLTISDPDDQPLADVTVSSDSGFKGKTNAGGSVTLTGLISDEPTAVTLAAKGFAKRTVSLIPPLRKEEHVVLERAFSIAGNLVDDSGSPVSDAMAIVTMGAATRRAAVDSDGSFSLDVDVGKDFDLTFESPSTATVTRNENAGRSGEVRNLGSIRLPSGMSVHGRLVDSTEAPVAGARVWVVRSSPGGTVVAWVGGRVVQATSDADGKFDLRGLSAGPALLRIDAPDYARAYRNVVAEPLPVDLGSITMVRGSTVTVKARKDDATVARLDLRGEWLDADMITAPVVEGEARVRNVPPGQYKVTVSNARAITCERRVDVKEGADASVVCPPPMKVRGRVLLSGAPAYSGMLTWTQPSETDALVNTRLSPFGAMQQQQYGVSGGIVVIALRQDGTFETDELRPGQWQVAWRSVDSISTPDRAVTVPDVAEAQVVVEFSGGVIRGRVLDEHSQPVAMARIREIQGPLSAMSAQDGSFTLTAVAPGLHRLQAALGAKASKIVEVMVETDKQTPEVTFELDDDQRDVLTIRVLGIDGEPKANAFVFAEGVGGIIKTLSADANGTASVAFAEGLPNGARLVAFADNAWAFGELRRSDGEGDAQNATIRFVRNGALRIRSRTLSGTPALLSARVPGDLSWMLGRLGSFVTLSPEAPVVIQGLPPGMYEVRLGEESGMVAVTAGSTATVDLR